MNTIWTINRKKIEHDELRDDITCDAVVIGGGLCGVLCAYKLNRAGLGVVLLEADRLGSGQTCGTTAKITVAHGEIYSKISASFSEKEAEIYASAANEAINEYKKTVKAENIDCAFKILPSYLYSLHGERHINAEYEIATKAGVNCSVTKDTSLPFKITSALRFEDQAQFNPLAFIDGISNGFDIYENSRVTDISGERVICEHGSVTARHIVIATNYPVHGGLTGLYPLKLHRKTAHVCTFTECPELNEMYIGIDGGYNYRSYEDQLIVSGEKHVSGLGTGGAYDRIRKNTMEKFKGAIPELYWSSEDSVSVDLLPYIGHVKGGSADVWLAVGFLTWGMTKSMTAACLIRDLICGKHNNAAELFSPKRFKINSSVDELGGMISRAVTGIVFSRFQVPEEELSSLPSGMGKIVRYMGHTVGAYRDENGKVHTVDAHCPHLRCELKWNGDDLTWDCPCHGSRFDIDGKLLTGPAENNI